jgi:hypothetical protein
MAVGNDNAMTQPDRILKFGDFYAPPLASQPARPNPPNFKFERPDWTLFRSVGTLSQKAGAPKSLLRRLVLALVEWLDGKISEHDVGKVIPPSETIAAKIQASLDEQMREAITGRILKEAGIDKLVADALADIDIDPDIAELETWLDESPECLWTEWADIVAEKLARDEGTFK